MQPKKLEIVKDRHEADYFLRAIMWFVYILECKDGSFYTGITNDLKRRFSEHKDRKGGHYTSSHRVKKLLYSEKLKTKGAALKREHQIKSWHKEKKSKLINLAK